MAANEARLKVLDLQIKKAELANEAIEKQLKNIQARGENIAATGENIKSKGTAKAGAKDDKQDEADAKREDKQYGQFRRDASRIDFEYKRPVQEATDAFKKAVKVDETKVGIFSVFSDFGGGSSPIEDTKGSDTKRAQLPSTKAWRELQELKQEIVQRKLNALEAMPEGKQKDRIYNSLQAELESIDTMSLGPKQRETKGRLDKPDAPPPKDTKTPSSTSATSNKPAVKLTQAQNDAAITKANEAIKNGADPEKVKARLKERGVSFKE
jgi:hypothetical protein